MGCCKSVLRVSRPVRANMFHKSQEQLEEETKNPDYFRRSSEVVELSPTHPEAVKETTYPSNQAEQKRNLENSIARRETEFNLNRDLMESMRLNKSLSRTLRKDTISQDMEVSTYKITREQHELIFKFVEEVVRLIDCDLSKLYDYLMYYYSEYEELNVSIEQLKNNNRDLENCIEDLKAFPIVDEKTYYHQLERRSRICRSIVWEYNFFKQGNPGYGYTEFKDRVLNLLRKYNSGAPDDDMYNKPQVETKNDDGGKSKETAATTRRGLTVTDRTEVNGYGGTKGNWSQSEVSGGPVWETERERAQMTNESTIFKKDRSEIDEGQGKVGVSPIDFGNNGLLQNSRQNSREEKENIFDVFPRRVKSGRRDSRDGEMMRKNSGNMEERDDLESINVYLEEEQLTHKLERRDGSQSNRVSGHLAMVMKLKKINQQRQEEMSYGQRIKGN